MSEIEKMYENANIKAKEYCDRDSDACMTCCPEWENRQNCWKYKSIMPPFTAEKQIELIIFIINKFGTLTFFDYEKFTREVMAEKIAKLLNNHWQNLSDILKQQVKGILE